jgi:hypothetical protein
MPRSSIVAAAALLGAVIDISIERNDVPACSPMMPFDANRPMVPVVSSIETPIDAAVTPAYFIAPAMSATEPCALPAAAE